MDFIYVAILLYRLKHIDSYNGFVWTYSVSFLLFAVDLQYTCFMTPLGKHTSRESLCCYKGKGFKWFRFFARNYLKFFSAHTIQVHAASESLLISVLMAHYRRGKKTHFPKLKLCLNWLNFWCSALLVYIDIRNALIFVFHYTIIVAKGIYDNNIYCDILICF